MKLYIYQFHWKNGVYEWLYGPGINEVKKWYLNYSELDNLGGCHVSRVAKADWDKFIVEMSECATEHNQGKKISFTEYMKTEASPNSIDIIAQLF